MALPRGKDTLADTTRTKPPGLKAIETRYNGYHFRSRLEARWAVFFDALGIQYEYEPEGYELPSGDRYLPDFYLPREAAYLEIKGPEVQPTEEHKAGQLAKQTGKIVLMLQGQPGQHKVMKIEPSESDTGWRKWDSHQQLDYDSDSQQLFTWALALDTDFDYEPVEASAGGVTLSNWLKVYRPETTRIIACRFDLTGDALHPAGDYFPGVAPEYVTALEAARSARFEYGQTPRP